MAAAGSPIAPGALNSPCSLPVVITSTQPASQGKFPDDDQSASPGQGDQAHGDPAQPAAA